MQVDAILSAGSGSELDVARRITGILYCTIHHSKWNWISHNALLWHFVKDL